MMKTEFQSDIIKQAVRDAMLPRVPIEEEWIIEALNLIREAYDSLKLNHSDQLKSFNEVKLNTLLQMQLLTDLKKDVNQHRRIDFVIKGNEFPNYDATKLEMRPDLTFFLRSPPNFVLIFCEVKILDKENKKTIARYCRDGLLRFIDGDYAWIDSDAIMIAYVFDWSTIDPDLISYLKLKSNPELFKMLSYPIPVPNVNGDVSFTTHNRNFGHEVSSENISGPIKIWHNWLT